MSEFFFVSLATWAVTYGIVSGSHPDEPDSENENYYGEKDGFWGPLKLYCGIRWLLWKLNAQEGICRVCISFWAALFFSLLVATNIVVFKWIVLVMAVHGAIIVYSNIVRIVTTKVTPQGGIWHGYKINSF